MNEARKLSRVAADRDVYASACRIVQTLDELHGVASCGVAISQRIGEMRGDSFPEQPVVACDKDLNPLNGERWFVHTREDAEVCQHWLVSSWLAERLAAHGELVLLLCDEQYVWARYGCGYAVEEDLTFLDDDDDDDDDERDVIEPQADQIGGSEC